MVLKFLGRWITRLIMLAVVTSQNSSDLKPIRSISIDGNVFLLDGEPLQVLSGSLHYFRAPAQLWRDRLRKLRAAGLNAVSTYVEWSFHEPEERQYRFEGDHDVAQFVRTAAEEELLVLLRPGPYICAERDLGGLPYWILSKYPVIKLRSADEEFISETSIWMDVLFSQLSPLLYGNGGPIILVQIENEYGVYGSDMTYKKKLLDIVDAHVGTGALLYTADGADWQHLQGGAMQGALPAVNLGFFSTLEQAFHGLRRVMPQGPLLVAEFYVDWLSRWGEVRARRPAAAAGDYLRDLLAHGVNVNLYMFHGGTNFEFTSGAHLNPTYKPQITSYDYDAPLDEAGDPTPKYYAIRSLIEQFNPGLKKVDLPKPSPKLKPMKIKLTPQVNLLSEEGRLELGKSYGSVTGSVLPSFEQLRQRTGLVLYETKLNGVRGNLTILKPRDRVYVFVDYTYVGVVDRMKKPAGPLLIEAGSVLSLLVENQGRVNFGHHLNDFKGILSDVIFENSALGGVWTVVGYPLVNISNLTSESRQQFTVQDGPVLYEGNFNLPEGTQPMDSFLDTEGWVKGCAWVNGYNLGRFWPALGPQRTLYVPGAWLNPSLNRLQVLELEPQPTDHNIALVDRPILNSKT